MSSTSSSSSCARGRVPTSSRPQRVLLQRLATQGDVFPSRVPAPLNITEVGGYLNLLQSLGQDGVQGAAIASALGVAGPPQQGVGLAGAVPVGFVEVANDRPAGPAQPSIPPALTIRADFHAPFLTVLATLHASGCALPLRAPRPELPASQPGVDWDVDRRVGRAGRARPVDRGLPGNGARRPRRRSARDRPARDARDEPVPARRPSSSTAARRSRRRAGSRSARRRRRPSTTHPRTAATSTWRRC